MTPPTQWWEKPTSKHPSSTAVNTRPSQAGAPAWKPEGQKTCGTLFVIFIHIDKQDQVGFILLHGRHPPALSSPHNTCTDVDSRTPTPTPSLSGTNLDSRNLKGQLQILTHLMSVI